MAGILLNRSRQVPAEETPAFGGIAERFRRAGDLDRAIALCRDGLKRFPEQLSARVTLGWALLDKGQYDEARGELERVLRKAPDNLAAIRGLAELHDRSEGAMPSLDDTHEIGTATAPIQPPAPSIASSASTARPATAAAVSAVVSPVVTAHAPAPKVEAADPFAPISVALPASSSSVTPELLHTAEHAGRVAEEAAAGYDLLGTSLDQSVAIELEQPAAATMAAAAKDLEGLEDIASMADAPALIEALDIAVGVSVDEPPAQSLRSTPDDVPVIDFGFATDDGPLAALAAPEGPVPEGEADLLVLPTTGEFDALQFQSVEDEPAATVLADESAEADELAAALLALQQSEIENGRTDADTVAALIPVVADDPVDEGVTAEVAVLQTVDEPDLAAARDAVVPPEPTPAAAPESGPAELGLPGRISNADFEPGHAFASAAIDDDGATTMSSPAASATSWTALPSPTVDDDGLDDSIRALLDGQLIEAKSRATEPAATEAALPFQLVAPADLEPAGEMFAGSPNDVEGQPSAPPFRLVAQDVVEDVPQPHALVEDPDIAASSAALPFQLAAPPDTSTLGEADVEAGAPVQSLIVVSDLETADVHEEPHPPVADSSTTESVDDSAGAFALTTVEPDAESLARDEEDAVVDDAWRDEHTGDLLALIPVGDWEPAEESAVAMDEARNDLASPVGAFGALLSAPQEVAPVVPLESARPSAPRPAVARLQSFLRKVEARRLRLQGQTVA